MEEGKRLVKTSPATTRPVTRQQYKQPEHPDLLKVKLTETNARQEISGESMWCGA